MSNHDAAMKMTNASNLLLEHLTKMSHNWRMNTANLIDRLRAAPNVRAVAREAQLSDRQVYRILHGVSSPTLRTAEKISAALDRLHPVSAAQSPAEQPAPSGAVQPVTEAGGA